MNEYYTRLKVEIEESGGYELDSLSPHTIRFESDMSDCSVHAWFAAFEKILALQGFSEHTIAAGACQLAFNEMRDKALMQKVAHEYDLKLLEDIDDYEPPAPVVVTADV